MDLDAKVTSSWKKKPSGVLIDNELVADNVIRGYIFFKLLQHFMHRAYFYNNITGAHFLISYF